MSMNPAMLAAMQARAGGGGMAPSPLQQIAPMQPPGMAALMQHLSPQQPAMPGGPEAGSAMTPAVLALLMHILGGGGAGGQGFQGLLAAAQGKKKKGSKPIQQTGKKAPPSGAANARGGNPTRMPPQTPRTGQGGPVKTTAPVKGAKT